MTSKNNVAITRNIFFIFGLFCSLFLCSCYQDSNGAKVRKSWLYIGNDGFNIGPSFEASVSAKNELGHSEVKYENKNNNGSESFHMSTGAIKNKEQQKTRSQTTINVNVDNSKMSINNSSNSQTTTKLNTKNETTNIIDASSKIVDKRAINNDSSVNVNSNNSNSKVNSENKKP